MSPIKTKIPREKLPFFERLMAEVNYRLKKVEDIDCGGKSIPRYFGEFWTSKQRQAHSLHEISYRACFKPQLPKFFIEHLSNQGDVVYDPFSGRGTTILEAALLGRNVISNDINPLSRILCEPRLSPPFYEEIETRLREIPMRENVEADIDLSMFYDKKTESEIISLRNYLNQRKETNEEDAIDRWIRMVATNRLSGHSAGFFSVYSLPPNQAVSPESQRKINERLQQQPEYRDTRTIILKKSRALLNDVTLFDRENLNFAAKQARFLTSDARETKAIKANSVQITVTSPPFLDVVNYAQDNWLRFWFNNINPEVASKTITVVKTIEEWSAVMFGVFRELYRITKPQGFVAFEVGEVKRSIHLDEFVVPLGIKAGFTCLGIFVNSQQFTKTSKIWGVENNVKGTNSNRIVLFRKIEK